MIKWFPTPFYTHGTVRIHPPPLPSLPFPFHAKEEEKKEQKDIMERLLPEDPSGGVSLFKSAGQVCPALLPCAACPSWPSLAPLWLSLWPWARVWVWVRFWVWVYTQCAHALLGVFHHVRQPTLYPFLSPLLHFLGSSRPC